MKHHYYLFAFYQVLGNSAVHHSVSMGLPQPRVTQAVINKAKQAVGMASAVLLSVSYLGEMTEEEFGTAPA